MATKKTETLFLTGYDPLGDPRGGQTTFARHVMEALGDQIAVASFTSGAVRAGEWFTQTLHGHEISRLSLGPLASADSSKPVIPQRIHALVRAARQMRHIREAGYRNLFVDCPELLLAASYYKWSSVCYMFHGANNFVANSRYRLLRLFGGMAERLLVSRILASRPIVLLAAADERAISAMKERAGGALDAIPIASFPTRVDVDQFDRGDKHSARLTLGLGDDDLVLVTVGRLCWVKGWDLLLQAAQHLAAAHQGRNFRLLFVGDGEDRAALEKAIASASLGKHVAITGFVPPATVRQYLWAADVYAVGSYCEGWSVAMLEALACGLPIVSTAVSAVTDLVTNGVNGYILEGRSAPHMAEAILRCTTLPHADTASREVARRYSVSSLRDDLAKAWPVLQHGDDSARVK